MPAVEIFRAGAIGSIVRLTVEEDGVAVNISAVSTKNLIFIRPNGSMVVKTASFTTDGTDGKLQYTDTTGSLLDWRDPGVLGQWRVAAELLGLSSWSGESSPGAFLVEPRLRKVA